MTTQTGGEPFPIDNSAKRGRFDRDEVPLTDIIPALGADPTAYLNTLKDIAVPGSAAEKLLDMIYQRAAARHHLDEAHIGLEEDHSFGTGGITGAVENVFYNHQDS